MGIGDADAARERGVFEEVIQARFREAIAQYIEELGEEARQKLDMRIRGLATKIGIQLCTGMSFERFGQDLRVTIMLPQGKLP